MLSLSMIVRNEEARLATCLASVKGFADEMVVVDTGSIDGTMAIAEQAGGPRRADGMAWGFCPCPKPCPEIPHGRLGAGAGCG